MIKAEDMQQAEEAIARVYQIVAGTASHERVLMAARVEPEAFKNFAQNHKEVLFKKFLPDVDPRDEPAIMTMLLHFFATGAVAQRISEGKGV